MDLDGFCSYWSFAFFNCANLKTATQVEQKARSLAGWLLGYMLCVPVNVLAL
jgi:hypothetical protein